MPARVNKCVNQNFVVISRQARQVFRKNRGYCTILSSPPVYAGEDLTSLSRSPVASLRISASICFQIWPARIPRHTLVLSPDWYASRGRWQGRSADYTKFRAAGHPPVLGGGFSQGTDLPTVGEPGRGNILFRPTVHIDSYYHRFPLWPHCLFDSPAKTGMAWYCYASFR